ncbi:autotransporter assembly complex protein TamA [Hyphomonas pacifica]|uniref:Bacterial surface antigen (D15) domain-containing protein n=1 Tax=Hyphomonas pacifica TaxID=1280941 RepID=A0A062U5V3_9PROT|nr:autotransporter assembly complex family protein [Hyphomonas pacifica]KCZ51540.1 hypothetical protein HY2_11060 [Hyphomonas pacifica]RAN34120.1 hypothetical protein HY3_11180 [Hyphomonas pacifica]
MPVTVDGLPENLERGAESALQIRGEKAGSVLEARRRATQAANTLQEYLASEGYFAAIVSPELVESTDTRPRLDVSLGERFRIASIDVTGTDDLTPQAQERIRADLDTLRPGAWARTPNIEALETLLLRQLKSSGYAFAESDGIDALASRAEKTVELTYSLKPGELVRLGEMTIPEGLRTKDKAIRVLQNWDEGDLYSPEKMETLRTRVRSTGLFDGIGVDIHERPDANGTHTVDLQLSEGKRRTIGAGVSYSTTDGAGANASWERRNLMGMADTVSVEAQYATLARHLKATYKRPNIGRYGRTLTAEAGVRDEETDAYDLKGIKVAANLSQPLNKNFTLSAGAAVDATRSTDYELRAQGINSLQDQVTLSFPLGATYDTVKDPLDPQTGNRAYLGVEPGFSFGTGVVASYTRIQGSVSTYTKVAERLVGALRLEAGSFLGDDSVPVDRKFYSGGGGTVRGYEYQSLSPKDPLGEPIGGDAMLNVSGELRWRKSERWGYVAFIDAGAAESDLSAAAENMRSAFGLGVRFYPGFGPVRLDIATPLNPRDGDEPVQLYISIGQAF